VVLDGTKTLLCQLCVGRVCLLKHTIILGKTGACKNGTNGKLGRNGTLMLYFSKLKPQTLHPKPPTLEHPPLTQTPTQTPEPQVQTQNPHLKPLLQTPNPHPNIENMCYFYLLFHLCHYYLCHFYWTLTYNTSTGANFLSPFIAEL